MAYQIQHRRDTLLNWDNANPILADGEIGYITGTSTYRLGDGKTPWKELKNFGFNGKLADLESETDDQEHEAVDKQSLKIKFKEINDLINDVNDINDTQETTIGNILNTIGITSEGTPTEISKGISKDISDIKEIINNEETGVASLNTKTNSIHEKVFGIEAGPDGQPEAVPGLIEKVEKLEGTHVSLTQSEYDKLKQENHLVEGNFYYIYEEAK